MGRRAVRAEYGIDELKSPKARSTESGQALVERAASRSRVAGLEVRTRSSLSQALRCSRSRRPNRLCFDNPEGEGGSAGRASMHIDSIAASI